MLNASGHYSRTRIMDLHGAARHSVVTGLQQARLTLGDRIRYSL
jgi:hypothetical protein